MYHLIGSYTKMNVCLFIGNAQFHAYKGIHIKPKYFEDLKKELTKESKKLTVQVGNEIWPHIAERWNSN